MSLGRPLGDRLLWAAVVVLVSACGGGGEDAPSPPPNVAPVAAAGDDLTVNERDAVTLDGGASSDPDGTIQRYQWVQTGGPAVTLTGADTASATFSAPETLAAVALDFDLTVTDNAGATDTDGVQVTVNPVNDPPVASAATFTLDEDSALAGQLDGADPEGDALSFSRADDATHGTLALASDGSFSYVPRPDFSGTDRFTFTVSDGAATSAPATVTLTINPVNDPPVAQDSAFDAVEDQPLGGTLAASDVDSPSLTFARVGSPANGTVAVNADGAFTYTPGPNYNGPDSFTFKANDGVLDSNVATVSIAVAAVNDAPTIAPIADRAIDEDTSTGGIAVTVDDLESDPAGLAVSASADNTALLPEGSLRLGGGGRDRTLTITPAANAHGAAVVTVSASDGSASTSRQFRLTVNPVNDAPVADGTSASGAEDGVISGKLSASDVDGDPLTFVRQSGPAHGTLDLASSGAFAYTPAANFHGADSFTFTVSDGQESSAPATVGLTISSVNDLPVANDDGAATDEDTPVDIDVLANDSDVDGTLDPASVAVTDVVHGAAVADPASGKVRFTPDANYFGPASFRYTVADDEGGVSNPATVSLSVASVNDAPVAVAATFRGNEDTTIRGTLEASDVEGDELVFFKDGDPADGTLVIEPDGAFTYTPRLNFGGDDGEFREDSFEFRASDGPADSERTRATIRVDGVSEPTLTIQSVSRRESDGTAEFVVSLSRSPDGAVAVSYATADGTAAAGSDYVETRGDLRFETEGDTEHTITVALTDDTFDENHETFAVEVAVAPTDVESVANATASATGTILDDDDKGLLRVGAAKRSVTPTQQHIDGVVEPRLDGTTHVQKFNLGGFGVNPLQNLPDDPDPPNVMQQLGEALTQPAECRVFGVVDPEEPEKCHKPGSRGAEHTHVRVIVLEQPGGTRIAFVMLDAIGAGNLIQKGLKEAVNAAACELGACFAPAGTPGEQIGNIVFGQTHSHAGADLQGLWGGVPQDWVHNVLYTQAADAARGAFQVMRPARVTFQQGYTLAFNNYRRPRYDPEADADGTLTLVRATGDDGTPVGSLLQYNAHPTSINEDPRFPHADYIQGAMDWLEDPATGPGGVALYYNGPIADASPSGSRPGCVPAPQDLDYGNVRCRGEGMADAALTFASHELAPTIESSHVEVTLPITNAGFLALGLAGSFNRYYDFLMLPADQIPGIGPLVAAEMVNLPQLTPVARTLVSRVTIGGAADGLEIVTIPGEATNTFGRYIRGLTSNPNMMLLGLTQNSFGYILPEEEFNYVNPDPSCARLDEEPFCNSGLLVPFTGYEENVSLGPLTAPLLRIEGYNRLFPTAPEQNIPPPIAACQDPLSEGCILNNLGQRLDYVQRSIAEACRDPDNDSRTNDGLPEAFCALLDPETPFHDLCIEAGLPEDTCRVFGTGHPDSAAEFDTALSGAAFDAVVRGCDVLDPAHCLFPFPSDQFTVAAPAGSPQSKQKGGTGKRINISPLATPRNSSGKPIDPTEWNRNDGYSPGQMIVTYVPELAVNADGTIPGAPALTRLGESLDPAAAMQVLEVPEAPETFEPKRHLVWAEADLNAGMLLYFPGREFGSDDFTIANPKPKHTALIVRPGVNFREGRRYVVVLRNLQGADGGTLGAQTAFRACRDKVAVSLPPVQQRCAALESSVFPVLEAAGIPRDGSLYLAWDFTVASTNNQVARLRHMRDDAFLKYLGDTEDVSGRLTAFGRAPKFDVTEVIEFPSTHAELVREIKGTFTVPSYVVPADPSPADGQTELRNLINQLPQQLQDQLERGPLFAPIELSSPPNRLFFDPADGPNPNDPQGSRYGDGLPDRSGELSSNFTCRIAKSTLSNKSFADASPADVRPARPSLYGHGLLGDHGEMNQDQLRRLGNEQNMLFCATDWFGFASGDIPNVLTTTLDMSNFPVIPDGTQQGILNQMFLARLLRHPEGFVAHDAFRVGGAAVFDHREVFYDGNSQGGITGGVVIALSKDINRGSLGVPGMNYSTLLTRSVDFDIFSVPIYLSYPDDLDRNLIFSMIQMLWDRSDNNGYAHHMTDNAALRGPDNEILLHTAFGDHQVTMWSADVMARTIGARVDRTRVDPARHPDEVEYFGLEMLDYTDPGQAAGSANVIWDAPWTSTHGNCAGKQTVAPPVGNVPPREEGTDPHECPRREVAARCQKGHFLHGAGRLVDVSAVGSDPANCPAVPEAPAPGPDVPVASPPDYGGGLLGAVAQFMAELNDAIAALVGGDASGAFGAVQVALANFVDNLKGVPDGSTPGAIAGTDEEPADAAARARTANRDVEPIVLTGDKLGAWSAPSAIGSPYPYPSGAGGDLPNPFPPPFGPARDAHNGVILYPPPGGSGAPMGTEVSRIAAYRWDGGQFVEVPVQVDQRFPYFLANARSDFSFYSGTDEELTYEWDVERWGDGDPADPVARYAGATADPVTGLDHDDEVVVMGRDTGTVQAPPGVAPADPDFDPSGGLQEVILNDPLDAAARRFVYLALKQPGTTGAFFGGAHYVNYDREVDADPWIDRFFFRNDDPEKLGSSNRGYGPNRSGKVQPGEAFYGNPAACAGEGADRTCDSTDRFPRDGVTVTTDSYLWRASGRWMVREVHVARPDLPGVYGPDLVDRWKGRAFQQSPDSVISLVGFEDEQVNWEANSTLLGERCGPVRCIREVWGADSGTNVTKTETFYRDAVTYRYRVRVHPIPPDGLYTAWDYNRSAMLPTAAEQAAGVEGGRYFTVLRPQGVPVDGVNDDVGQVDGFAPVMTPAGPMCPSPADDFEFIPPDANGRCPAFFDTADPTFNLPMAFDNWEQVSGKGDAGSLVYTFEIKGATSLLNPLVVPYYRDDSCLDDGTGDDPVPRPFPGDSYRDGGGRVPGAYRDLDGNGRVDCHERQGAYGAHGVHYFFTQDIDNSFVLGKPNNETDGQQWQFMVPTERPKNVAEPYANVVRAPLQAVVTPRLASDDSNAAPDLGDLCTSYGVPATSPLCGLLEATHARLQDACAASGAGAAECSLVGGNLHAVLEACYLRGPGQGAGDASDQLRYCKVVDSFATGAAAFCRQFSALSGGTQPPELCALIGGVLVSEEALAAHERSWVHRALSLQNDLGYDLPLVDTSIVATHNSYNATDANTPPTLSGSDANQLYDFDGQLRMGVRAIELDVHWVPTALSEGSDGVHGPVVCHARPANEMDAGCTTERPLRAVLQKLRAWLDDNPGEVIVLYVEDHLEGPTDDDEAHAVTARVFDEEIGHLVFGPGAHGAACGDDAPITDPDSWLHVSRQAIADKGKQVLMYAESCGGGRWDGLFHKKTDGAIRQGQQSTYDDKAYPACVFADQRGEKWLRVWEDSTFVAAVSNAGSYDALISPAAARELMRCGLNMPSLDQLQPRDGRLEAMVWSWAENEPTADATRNCAVQNADGRFVAADCAGQRPYACVNDGDPYDWRLAGSGAWSGGDAACAALDGYHFGVPGNGYANERLKEARTAAGASAVWLAYSDAGNEGVWSGPGVSSGVTPARAVAAAEAGLLRGIAAFLGTMVDAAGQLLGAQLEAFVAAVGEALSGLADSVFAALIGNDSSLLSAFERLIANLRALDTENVARDFARDLRAVLNGGGVPVATGVVKAGVGVVDMTPDVGYCSGQYCDIAEDHFEGAAGGDTDPYLTHKTKRKSDGVQSRLTARAIVVEGANGKRIALVKTDNYLAQDNLMRRVGQILAEKNSSIGYPQILHHVTHNHTAAYSATLSWGPWLFEDAYDARFFENQARKIAEAVLIAEADLRPARMGATAVRHTIYKGNVVGPARADDGTPAGYPREYGDHGLVVMRFDDVSDPANPQPLAVWINWGEHPESLDGPNLHSADFLAALERWVDRATGVPLVFSQGDVGSAERSGNPSQLLADDGTVCGQWPESASTPTQDACAFGEGVLRDWQHRGFVQTERNVRYLADAVIAAFDQIGKGDPDVQVPATDDFVVDYRNAWVPGPLSHPYPAVSNCRSQPTVEGSPNAPLIGGPPDCERLPPGENPLNAQLAEVVNSLKVHGMPVPDHYDVYSHVGLEENNRLYLQAFRLGEVLLASCACEVQADLVLNLESRTDRAAGNVYDGFDWACLLPQHRFEPVCQFQEQNYFDPVEFPTAIPGSTDDALKIAHMRAQIHNDARGWDAPDYAGQANSEPLPPADNPTDFSAIKGNFTREEIQEFGVPGYTLPVAVGHAGDYNGYTVSYREFMNRDHYRKSLTSYGAHTADYMATRLVKLAAAMQGGPELAPEPHDAFAQGDEARQVALSQLHGQATATAFDAFHAVLPDDFAPQIGAEPQDVTRFSAATFTWRGGSTAVDNPAAVVQRELAPGVWLEAYDTTGEVQTGVHWPQGIPDTLPAYAGRFEWKWSANFEAYTAFPARLGGVPEGRYRFVVHGRVKSGGEFEAYRLESAPFRVLPWNGISIADVSRGATSVSFTVPPIVYPRSYAHDVDVFPFIGDDGNPRICETCTFRPWARAGRLAKAEVIVQRALGGTETIAATCTTSGGTAACSADVVLLPNDTATARVFDHDDNYGQASVPEAL